ncbi:ribosomal protein S18-alanine N-acetyltransferase [Vibrio sp. WJH972]
MSIKIVPMNEAHLPDIWQIERQAHTHPWKESMIFDLNSRCAIHHTLLYQGKVAGYFYAQNIVGEVTLLNVAIEPEYQKKGLGRQLLSFLISYTEKQSGESIWLEVRESNNAAQALYHSLGFNEIDRRIDYYPASNGKEDAIIMNYVLGFDFS